MWPLSISVTALKCYLQIMTVFMLLSKQDSASPDMLFVEEDTVNYFLKVSFYKDQL